MIVYVIESMMLFSRNYLGVCLLEIGIFKKHRKRAGALCNSYVHLFVCLSVKLPVKFMYGRRFARYVHTRATLVTRHSLVERRAK